MPFWSGREMYFRVCDRVELVASYINDAPKGLRGNVLEDAPASLTAGVRVLWDDGEERVVAVYEARKLGLLELMAEIRPAPEPPAAAD
jgi:hypothetical protein